MSDTESQHTSGHWMWRKSSFSNGGNNNCVEVGHWRKSSFSEGGNNACVEVAHSTRDVGVRDSKNSDGPKLVFGHPRWLTFVTELSATHTAAN
ncbi:DUF397 domain-containing protein [Actinokineospora sp.]|uniref:DUF397 domain-containing protein n=1 Tax=Actinokineospora sp. TaxID=1872133 RepID=UPI004037DDD7